MGDRTRGSQSMNAYQEPDRAEKIIEKPVSIVGRFINQHYSGENQPNAGDQPSAVGQQTYMGNILSG